MRKIIKIEIIAGMRYCDNSCSWLSKGYKKVCESNFKSCRLFGTSLSYSDFLEDEARKEIRDNECLDFCKLSNALGKPRTDKTGGGMNSETKSPRWRERLGENGL